MTPEQKYKWIWDEKRKLRHRRWLREQGLSKAAAKQTVRDPLKYAHLRLFYYETVSAFGASHNVSLPALAFLSGDRKCRAIGSIVG